MSLRKDFITATIAVLVFTALLGVVYPVAIEGVSQLTFPGNANGQLVRHDGRVVGSKIIGQSFGSNPQFFQTRPSGTTPADNDAATTFANYGPNSTVTKKAIVANIDAYIKLNGSYVPGGLTAYKIPVDAANTSASGVDPDISVANADIQSYRVASVRHLSLSTVRTLIKRNTTGLGLGFLGQPSVKVMELNLALADMNGATR